LNRPKVADWNKKAWQKKELKQKTKPKTTRNKHAKESRSASEGGWHGVMSMLDYFEELAMYLIIIILFVRANL